MNSNFCNEFPNKLQLLQEGVGRSNHAVGQFLMEINDHSQWSIPQPLICIVHIRTSTHTFTIRHRGQGYSQTEGTWVHKHTGHSSYNSYIFSIIIDFITIELFSNQSFMFLRNSQTCFQISNNDRYKNSTKKKLKGERLLITIIITATRRTASTCATVESSVSATRTAFYIDDRIIFYIMVCMDRVVLQRGHWCDTEGWKASGWHPELEGVVYVTFNCSVRRI